MRTVVISGAGTGIGRGVAAAFARDGERVVLLGRRADVLSSAAAWLTAEFPSVEVLTQPCDVANSDSVEAFASWLDSTAAARIDVLVANAGARFDVPPPGAPSADAADYADRCLRANLVGAYLLAHVVQPRLVRPGGRIVYVSSVAAVRGGNAMYAAAKAGLAGLAYAQARELGPDGITVNVVSPGFVPDTEMFGGRDIIDRIESEVAASVVRRVGTVADIAFAIHYLASQHAGYVSGEVHHVNGGAAFGR